MALRKPGKTGFSHVTNAMSMSSRHVHADPTMLFLDEPTSGAAAAPANLVLTE